MIKAFFRLLFDPEESTSFAVHVRGTKVVPVDAHLEASKWANFFCINPLHPTADLDPYEDYHSADKPRRCDKNVIAYRNILVECDNSSIEEQLELIKSSGMPYSSAVYSGGKSIHFIISLTTPVETEESYRELVTRVHTALGGRKVVDTSTKNPSRFSRFPNAKRADTNKKQELLSIKSRVNNNDLNEWIISKIGPPLMKAATKSFTFKSENDLPTKIISGHTLNFMMLGAEQGERNISLFKASCDFCKCGYDEQDAIERLGPPSGLSDAEVARTVHSAYRKVLKNTNWPQQ